MVFGTYNELVTGAYKPTDITGGHHLVDISKKHMSHDFVAEIR
jgi:hypothetical protein